MMFQNFIKKFESSEKKIELVFSKKSSSLLDLPESFWKKIVRSCGADIVCNAKFPKVHSYILSESSLFVWQRRLLLITCGKTRLSKTLLKILRLFPKEHLEVCFFQRKNEFFPQIQKSCFQKDLQKIKNQIEGKAYRFGSMREHHFFLFHSETDFKPDKKDRTLEALIYGSESLKDSSPACLQPIKDLLERAFPGFKMQDYHFKPCGWSLNAVKGTEYYTVHLSPEESSFYISFETNIPPAEESSKCLSDKIINIFKPVKFDFILFEPQGMEEKAFELEGYFSSSAFQKTLSCSYTVTYKNFHKVPKKLKSPQLLFSSKRGEPLLKKP